MMALTRALTVPSAISRSRAIALLHSNDALKTIAGLMRLTILSLVHMSIPTRTQHTAQGLATPLARRFARRSSDSSLGPNVSPESAATDQVASWAAAHFERDGLAQRGMRRAVGALFLDMVGVAHEYQLRLVICGLGPRALGIRW